MGGETIHACAGEPESALARAASVCGGDLSRLMLAGVERSEEIEAGSLLIERVAVDPIRGVSKTSLLMQMEGAIEVARFLEALDHELGEDACRKRHFGRQSVLDI